MIPDRKTLLLFLKNNPDQTYTSISKYFNISNQTVKDLVDTFFSDLIIKKIGPSYIVNVKEEILKNLDEKSELKPKNETV